MSKVVGDNSHGNKNEINIVKALDNKRINSLNTNLKEFVKYVMKKENIKYDSNKIINAKYEPNNKLKQDFYLYIDDKELGVSLKMGTGNSVHQEKCEDFVSYIKSELKASDNVCNSIRFFIWADGTTDGTGSMDLDEKGEIIARFTSTEFKKNYPEKRKLIQEFFYENERDLIERFLFIGKYNSKVDYIYHGTEKDGNWISANDIINYQVNNSKVDGKSCLVVGKMSIQAWNISKKGNTEKKRGELQVKYSQMAEDFNSLMLLESENTGTFYGDRGEFDLSRVMNSNKKSKYWESLNCEDNEDLYVVKVEKHVKSKLSNKKVFAKSDAFIINVKLDDKFLLEREYLLSESDIEGLNYEIKDNTGISIKIKDSNKFSIHKFTKDSFMKMFNKYIHECNYVFLGLMLYSKKTEIAKNEVIFENLKINKGNFDNFCRNNLEITEGYTNLPKNIDEVREKCQKRLKATINSNTAIKEAIFSGRGLYDAPYFSDYLFKNGKIIKLTEEYIKNADFLITTGSGRSGGNYTVVIKNK